MRREKTTLKDVKNVKATGMRKPKTTSVNVKILKGSYHESEKITTNDVKNLKGFGEIEAADIINAYQPEYLKATSDKKYLIALEVANLLNITIFKAYDLLDNYNPNGFRYLSYLD